MFLNDFIRETGATRDTIRHYVDLNLLTPTRRGKNYWFTAKDQDDFSEIKELQELGFSLQTIHAIKNRHDLACGTDYQLVKNLQLVNAELQKTTQELQQLKQRQAKLQELKFILQKKNHPSSL
ncbi:MerR family transcriptional regulator [Lactobacillus xylocopicola]|uniref:HTH merR-type domain-containing protein n=1 Tax=Lactobacillus xylocopicola TaxID=2976676 RepID=A0ABN6SKC2_9LACO|nr:MerR family transcriptional regulator [Lactobacillus xylocopicola]BDR60649.1 hypothetical protein KIM322_09100 [Lactobacillus xylocopicola]